MSLGSSNLRAVQGIYHLKCTGHLYREKLVLKEVFNFFKLTLGIWIFISANINFSILLRGELVLYFTFVFCYSATSCFILASESRTQWTDFLVLEVQLQCQESLRKSIVKEAKVEPHRSPLPVPLGLCWWQHLTSCTSYLCFHSREKAIRTNHGRGAWTQTTRKKPFSQVVLSASHHPLVTDNSIEHHLFRNYIE